jgi:polyisoprenoid-binding protein YceI
MTAFTSTSHASSNLIRTVDGIELPTPGLWNIPSGWASIELSVPKVLGRALRTRLRLKQGMIAIADDPTHSTANLSLDATSLRTGHPARDRYLHDKVLNTDRYSTIPVRIATIEHCSGPHWKADGWITVGGVSTAMELDLTYGGSYRDGSIATFSAHGNIPLRGILAGRNELRSRLLAGQHIHISVEVHAEPVRATAIFPTRAERQRSGVDLATAI